MLFLSSIKYIDQIASFATDDELESLIYNIKPEFMVIGDDYKHKPIIGSQHIGEIFYVTRDGKSTSDIVDRIGW
jgi:bifunctional ADP-heptose synthase (sugar kinase/adenylyltransferase)